MDANGYSRPRKWPVEEEARYMFSYPRPPSQASTRTTIDMKGYVPMARLPRYPGALDDRHSSKKESYMTGASEFGTFRSIGSNTQGQSRPVSDIGYVEMKSEEPEYINVPNVKYNKGEGVHGAASMDYHIPVPRVLGQAKNVFEHHVYVNVPPRSRLTSGGIECSPGSCSSGVSHMSEFSPEFVSHSPGVSDVSRCSPEFVSHFPGVSDVSGCSPEFVSHFPGVSDVSGCSPEFVSRSLGVRDVSGCSPEFVSHSPGVRNVSGCSPEFVSRSLGVSDSESSPGLQSQPPMCDTALLRSTSSQNEEFDSRDMTGAGHLEEEPDSWADYRHVDMEPVVGGRCYHANPRHFDELEEQGYKCIVCVNQTNASRAFGMCGTYELKVDMVTPAIILTPREGSTTSITWPLHYIRRYGTDGNGIFRVEAGRRCYPGPGIFNFRVLSGNSQDILDKVELASEMHLNLSD
ncbi:uncharacterized protein LOC118418683 [Branchiostoma floridae]|uniref:Uncharacterized protein LOC118418683 n=1 Tax=Branchiostoma floridae TaxID=7739 RepID=A0A9J7MVM6_BRAFL|nr:uncharacterized protein LOC118418683 [Branchiostoma floridae]